MTRHGMVHASAAAAAPPATDTRASMAIARRRPASTRTSSGPPIPRDGATKRPVRIHLGASHRQSRHRRHRPQIRNPHSHRLWPAGSFLGDFRTPAGARNSSRKRNVWFCAAKYDSGRSRRTRGAVDANCRSPLSGDHVSSSTPLQSRSTVPVRQILAPSRWARVGQHTGCLTRKVAPRWATLPLKTSACRPRQTPTGKDAPPSRDSGSRSLSRRFLLLSSCVLA